MMLKLNNITSWREYLQKQSPCAWLRTHQRKAWERFQKQGLPDTRQEDWKYTNLSPLTQQSYVLAKDLPEVNLKDFPHYHNSDVNLVFVNGVFCEALSDIKEIPRGVTISSLRRAIREGWVSWRDWETSFRNPHAAAWVTLNNALTRHGCFIHLTQKVALSRVIHIVHVAVPTLDAILSVPRVIIRIDDSAQAHILESHLTVDDHTLYLAGPLTDIFLHDKATLYYGKIQWESRAAFHVGTTRVWQEKDSCFDGFTMASAGRLLRNHVEVILNGVGAQTAINGLYSARGSQHVDNHTSIEHRAPHGTSHQLYKGILHEASRGVFNGRIFVHPQAQQTSSYQLNKTLLLGEKCRMDTKPQLEIFADDVKCSHGATIGQMNPEELFYLRTRCIDAREATRMLCRGFVDDVMARIQSRKIWKKLQCKIPY